MGRTRIGRRRKGGMRITESMLTGSYTRNLQRNISNLAQSNLKLASEREYNHVS